MFSLVVACGPAGVPGAGGPGRCVCRWAAARPRAVRAASFARRVASKPARALRSLRHPPHRRRCVADVCLCVGSLSGQAPPLPINFARNSPAACSIIEFASLELQCFWGVSKNDHDKLRAKFGRRWCRCCPWAPPPGPAGQAARLSETPVTFAGAGRALIETAITFASDERPFLGHFNPAKVLSVSMGRAAWPAKVLLVSKLPRHRVLCAKKFALHARNTPKSASLRLLGELIRGRSAGGAVLGELFRGPALVGSRRASCAAPQPW